jgi:hypothetical protein
VSSSLLKAKVLKNATYRAAVRYGTVPVFFADKFIFVTAV